MFQSDSRYHSIATSVYTTKDGRKMVFAKRRFIPTTTDSPVLAEVTATEGDRLDLISARTLGNPEFFWQVADSNQAMNPLDLIDESGKTIKITLPQVF